MLSRFFWSFRSSRQLPFKYLSMICVRASSNGVGEFSQKTQSINLLYRSKPIAAVRLRRAGHSARSSVGPANVRCRVTWDWVWMAVVTTLREVLPPNLRSAVVWLDKVAPKDVHAGDCSDATSDALFSNQSS